MLTSFRKKKSCYLCNTMAGLSIFNIRRKATKEERFRELFLSMHPKLIRYATTSITLGDGTQVLLSANSQLIYDKDFTDKKREVTLVGEARFSVAKDDNRPFIVRTEQIQTQVLGTVFDVKAYPQTIPDVTLYEGKVEVSLNGKSPRKMQPGEQATISKEGKLQLAQASADQSKWTEGEFAFDNKKLIDVMIAIASWYNISVVCQHSHLLEERIYFHMERVKEVKDVLAVLNDMGIAKFELTEKKIVVSHK